MISRSIYVTEEPAKITQDHRGTTIQEGLRVAYNLSGDIAIGKIVGISKNEWQRISSRWILNFEIRIENENGRISKVKNPNGFVII